MAWNAQFRRGAARPPRLTIMPGAILLTLLGFALAIVLGLLGAWSADKIGAFLGISGGLALSFIATAIFAGR